MRLPSFRFENQRSIRLAECLEVPRLMVVAGPNGAGKSTLLDAIRRQTTDGTILYVGPHRNARRQVVQVRHLMSGDISLEALLSRSDIPGFEGVQFITGQRDPWSFDDTANYLKHGLCQVEVERKDAIAARYDQGVDIQSGSLPDPWKPLRELVSNLLPHLSFEKVDTSDKNEVRVLWRVHAKDTVVDLDDLSSGEKSIIQIFYPLIEAQIKGILREIQQASATHAHPEICVLIDEPELHLHPNLQVKVFDYLRLLTSRGRVQVIVATQSPTVVEYSSFEELFLLRPVEAVSPGENQLVQVATDEERLQFLREVFGTTSNLTALQPIVVVEGANETGASKSISDRKLYRALHPGFDRVTLVAGGGKAECIRLRDSLETTLKDFSPSVRAVALLDRDLATEDAPEGVTYLPVSMIENFLLDSRAIWQALQSVVEKTGFKTIEDVEAALDALVDEMAADETDRRVARAVGRSCFHAAAPIADIPGRADAFMRELQTKTSPEAIERLSGAAKEQVDKLQREAQRREHFHGKAAVALFRKRHLHASGMPSDIFAYEAARHARERKKVMEFFDDFFRKALPEIGAPIVGGTK